MNYRFIINQFGLLLIGFAVIMAILAGLFFSGEWVLHHNVNANARLALLTSAGVGLVVGGGASLATRRAPKHLGRREALLLVAVSWVLGAAFAALPTFLWASMSVAIGPEHPFRSYVSCYFEAMSGLTTTGATVLGGEGAAIEMIPRSLLLWRAMTHWLGGLGIVVLFVAVLPSLGVGGKRLFKVEVPGPMKEGLQPQIRETARILLYIYVGLTVIEVIALVIAGMSVFDAVCHTMATLATGGFSTRGASVGAYHGVAIRVIIIVFMILAGMNFGLFYQLLRRRFGVVLRDVELRLYLILMAIGSAVVFIAILGEPITMTTLETVEHPSVGTALSEAVFTTVSIQTTTGFCTSDFNRWPFLAQAVLVALMFCGASAGSTAGGIKVIRLWVAFRTMIAEIEKVFRPNVIRPVTVGTTKVDTDLQLSVLAFVLGMALLFIVGAGVVMLLEQAASSHCDFKTAGTASLACLCTIGPGLGFVGALESYGWFSDASKIVLSLLMVLGRLEVLAILVLFSPAFWRSH